MQDKLKWNAIGLVKKTRMLKEYIEREKIDIPIDYTKKHATISGFLLELNHILEQMEKIKKIKIYNDRNYILSFNLKERLFINLTEKRVKEPERIKKE